MTRQPAPDERPVTLSIAGSDSGGGAGIQADCKTMAACGAFPTSIITAVTAQNTQGVASTHVLPTAEIAAQLAAITDDFEITAVKTGMLASEPVIDLVADFAATFDGPIVVDPVMVATSGDRLLEPAAVEAYDRLFEHATLITPNTDEAAVLTDTEPMNATDARSVAADLRDHGAENVLLTGGHLPTEDVIDVLATSENTSTLSHPRVATAATHGTGCMLSSAITARLAHGESIDRAIDSASDLVGRAIRYHHDVGGGPGAVHHLVGLRETAHRQPLQETVTEIVQTLTEIGVRELVPEVGMNVVGATPFAETTTEIAAVEGRITKTIDGIHPNRGVRFGASSHMARFLLAMRECDPTVRFAINCRHTDAIKQAVKALSGPIAAYDRADEPTAKKENATMGWGARMAYESVSDTPVAVLDDGAHGKEPIIKLLAEGPETLVERVRTVEGALDEQ
ncbi:bifunctional hydroxymethylpyrimidine kinase/phosphomethylpyrimidine kinase [Halocatena halophila]|uniref:bifunctional hydroxymethylpyrimidine kinase/phosphomethylpyrimidine kinase n=1 Tax=Halocatena halophila TaxID=2814576 RepID=UPI002ED235D6